MSVNKQFSCNKQVSSIKISCKKNRDGKQVSCKKQVLGYTQVAYLQTVTW